LELYIWPNAPDILLESVVNRRCKDPRLSDVGCCWNAEKKELSARGGEVRVLYGEFSLGDRTLGKRSSSMRSLRRLANAMSVF